MHPALSSMRRALRRLHWFVSNKMLQRNRLNGLGCLHPRDNSFHALLPEAAFISAPRCCRLQMSSR